MNFYSFWNNFTHFISTNQVPPGDKLLVSAVTVYFLSVAIFILAWIINYLRNLDILILKPYGIYKCFLWALGAVLLNTVLVAGKIINYNIISFLVVAMVWDTIYQKIYKQAANSNIGKIDSLEPRPET